MIPLCIWPLKGKALFNMFFQLHCMKSLQIECWTVYKKPFKQRNARRSVFLRFISVSSFSKLTNMSRKLVLSQCNWKQLPLKLKESSRKWNLSEKLLEKFSWTLTCSEFMFNTFSCLTLQSCIRDILLACAFYILHSNLSIL